MYYIKPKDNDFLTRLNPDPLVAGTEIKEIIIDPRQRKWTFSLRGPQKGDPEFWDQLAQDIKKAAPLVQHVVFTWENDSVNDYMEKAIKSVTPKPANYGQPAPSREQNNRRRLLQETIAQKAQSIIDLQEEQDNVVVAGEIVSAQFRATRTGRTLLLLDIYDGTDTLSCKAFLNGPGDLEIKKGQWWKAQGNLQFQPYDKQLSLMIQALAPIEAPSPLRDDAPEKRVELHLHTKMSALDGTIDVEDAVQIAAALGHPAVAITDHGVVQAFPQAYQAGKKYGVKILYGLEGYLIEDENFKERAFHIILLAKNKVGLKNLYKLVSLSHLEHFYRTPRIPRPLLEKHRQGLFVGAACEAGEVYQAVLNKDPRALEIASFYDYLEIQPLDNNEFLIGSELVRSKEDLISINRRIVQLGEELQKPVVATCDVHFLRPEDAFIRTILLAGQGFEDAERQAPLYYRTTSEMLEEFSYLGPDQAQEVVVTNPRWLAEQIEELTPVPLGLHPPKLPDAEKQLEKMAYAAAYEAYGKPLPSQVESRLQRELDAIIGNGYASLYLISHKLVKRSLDNGYLVGSRGSVGSSLVATMCSITEVNPLPPHYVCPSCFWHEFFTGAEIGAGVDLPAKECPQCGAPLQRRGFDIPFEVFMGFHGDKVPDIDLNFSGECQGEIHSYTEELFGKEHVYRAGTIGTLADKTAYGFIMKYLEEAQEVRRRAEINRLVGKLTGVRRTTGQHPGGMVVVPPEEDIYDFTPIQHPANDSSSGIITTHFEYDALEDSLVKLDILGHDDPTMLRALQDLTGVEILTIPFDDPQTMAIFSGLGELGVAEEEIGTPVGTLGIPEFGTPFVRQMLVDTRPSTFSELVRISGLSHGTNVWANNAQKLIKDQTADLNNVIATRDDIMSYLLLQGLEAADAFRIMEQVRRGRGLTADDESLLRGFSIPEWYLDSCRKISYMFPKAHAVAYVMMAFRIAYFKVHYPLQFYAALFSLRTADFDAHLVAQGGAEIRKAMAEISEKGNQATAKERSVYTQLEIVIEAMARGIQFWPVDLYNSAAASFKIEKEGLLPPLASLQGVGVNAAAGIVQARQQGEFISIEDLRLKSGVTKAVIEALRLHGVLSSLPETNQLTLF